MRGRDGRGRPTAMVSQLGDTAIAVTALVSNASPNVNLGSPVLVCSGKAMRR